MSSQQVSIITELQYLIAMLVFLTINAHHLFFQAIAQSYSVLPPLTFHFSGQLMQFIFDVSREMFVIALKLAAPITAVMIFTNVGLGIVARTVPQMNIFIVGFPLQISLGLVFLGLTAPLFVRMTQGIFGGLEGKILSLLRLM
jgi:flagellar biosynthetic protein FliR